MFESITIHRRNDGQANPSFSLGHICECMFFYKEVNIVCTRLELEYLIKGVDLQDFITSLENKNLNIFLNRESFGAPPLADRRFGYMIVNKMGGSLESEVYKGFHNIYHNSTKAIRGQQLLLSFISEYKYQEDLIDDFVTYEDFSKLVLRTVIRKLVPDYPIPAHLIFRMHASERGSSVQEYVLNKVYDVETNFDFSEFERDLSRHGYEFTQGFMVQFAINIIGAVLDLGLAAGFSSELALEDMSAQILQAGMESLSIEGREGQKEIISFQENVIDPLPSISTAINTGERSFSEFIRLLKKSEKFKAWLNSRNFELGLVNQYIHENELSKFTDSEDVSVIKYLYSKVGSGLLAATIPLPEPGALIAGYAAKKIVESIMDKLNYWRPNQFVNSSFKGFVSKK